MLLLVTFPHLSFLSISLPTVQRVRAGKTVQSRIMNSIGGRLARHPTLQARSRPQAQRGLTSWQAGHGDLKTPRRRTPWSCPYRVRRYGDRMRLLTSDVGTPRTWRNVRHESVMRCRADIPRRNRRQRTLNLAVALSTNARLPNAGAGAGCP
jgi:hypothetical protein